MKKILIAFLFLISLTSLIACNDKNKDNKTTPDVDTMEPTSSTGEPSKEETPEATEEIIYDKDITEVDKKYLTGKYNLAKNVQDGVILHAWNWSYNTIKEHLPYIADAGFSAVQTSPVQHSKSFNPLNRDVKGTWWKLYQPTSFQIGEGWLGTKDELKALCEEAKTYGIKIICDIVFNHMANAKEGEGYDKDILKYEPTIGKNPEEYFRPYGGKFIGDREQFVHGDLNGLPDLKTENPYIQERAYSLLKECIDCGVSGFRFDASKHIETPSDEKAYASDFWLNTLVKAKNYAKTTYDKDIYAYGEVLGEPGQPSKITYYTDLMSVTDDHLGGAMTGFVGTKNMNKLMEMVNSYKATPEKSVLWCESHDTYASAIAKGPEPTVAVRQAWSIIANRKGATALYLARSGEALMGEIGNYNCFNQETIVVNEFHNHFINAEEIIEAQGDYFVNERYRKEDLKAGVMITNISAPKSVKDISIKVKHLKDGTYFDQLSGNMFTVKDGVCSGKMSKYGFVCLYDHKLKIRDDIPQVSIKYPSNFLYEGKDVTVKLNIKNADSIKYQIDDSEFKNISKTGSIKITKASKLTIVVEGRIKTEKVINFKEAKFKEGYYCVGGISSDTILNKAIYAWVWKEGSIGKWREVLIENNCAYIKAQENDYGLLLAYFDSDVTIDQANFEDYTPTQTSDLGKPLDINTCYSAL